MNKVILEGHVGKDPEVRYMDSGIPVANFSLATSKRYTNKSGEKVTDTQWHNIVVWRKLAEVAEKYVKKGSNLLIEGEITYRSYEDSNKVKRFVTEILAISFEMIGPRKDEPEKELSYQGVEKAFIEKPAVKSGSLIVPPPEEDDDLPF